MIPNKSSTEKLSMETETPKNAPILEIAWTRFAQLGCFFTQKNKSLQASSRLDRPTGRPGNFICHHRHCYLSVNNVQLFQALVIK